MSSYCWHVVDDWQESRGEWANFRILGRVAFIMFLSNTFKFYLESLKFYEHLLTADMDMLNADPDIRLILDDETLRSHPLNAERQKTERIREWMEKKISEQKSDIRLYVSISHGTVRFLKSVTLLYLEHLKQQRNMIASRHNISRYTLEALGVCPSKT